MSEQKGLEVVIHEAQPDAEYEKLAIVFDKVDIRNSGVWTSDGRVLMVDNIRILNDFEGNGEAVLLELDSFSFRMSQKDLPENIAVAVLELSEKPEFAETKITISNGLPLAVMWFRLYSDLEEHRIKLDLILHRDCYELNLVK